MHVKVWGTYFWTLTPITSQTIWYLSQYFSFLLLTSQFQHYNYGFTLTILFRFSMLTNQPFSHFRKSPDFTLLLPTNTSFRNCFSEDLLVENTLSFTCLKMSILLSPLEKSFAGYTILTDSYYLCAFCRHSSTLLWFSWLMLEKKLLI